MSGTPILGMDPYLARIAKAQAAIQHLGDPGCLHSRHIVALFSVGTDAGGKLTHDIGLMLPRREELAVAMLLEVFVQLAKQRPTVFIGAMAKVKELNLGGTP